MFIRERTICIAGIGIVSLPIVSKIAWALLGYDYHIDRTWIYLLLVFSVTSFFLVYKITISLPASWSFLIATGASALLLTKNTSITEILLFGIIWLIWATIITQKHAVLRDLFKWMFIIVALSLLIYSLRLNTRYTYKSTSPDGRYVATIDYNEYTSWKGDTILKIKNTEGSIQLILGKAEIDTDPLIQILDYYIESPDDSQTYWDQADRFCYYTQQIVLRE